MLRKLEVTDGQEMWVDDRHVVCVWGERGSVKITPSTGIGHLGPFKGTVSDIALTFNGYFDD